jgi:23S rRNA (cytosine1962-C5)-methyltransferase
MSTGGSNSRLRLRISAMAEAKLRGGHPWVFASSIREQNREGAAGELAVIYDRKDRFLAVALFDPDSPIRARVLHIGRPQTIDGNWWSARLGQTTERRRGLFDERTTGYRLINGESDGWPGLVLDRYDSTLVLKLYTGVWRSRLEEIIGLIQTHFAPERIVLRLSRNIRGASPPLPTHPSPEEGGRLRAAGSDVWRDGRPVVQKGAGSQIGAPIVFLETGLRFEADVMRGQKTGFFLDQRENRRKVELLANECHVLNAFSFSGGFSLYAARGGARAVTDLDISTHALAGAQRNFALNQSNPAVARCRHKCVQADAFEWLKVNELRKFDLIILDPPSFAKRESDRVGAIRAYERLVSLGIKHLARDSVLLACSCSAHVSAEEFFGAAARSAAKSGRKFQVLEKTKHAADHPAVFKEAEYLKALYLRFQ